MALSDQYKIILHVPGEQPYEAKVCNSSLKWCYEWDEDYCIYRLILGTKLIFQSQDFQKMKHLNKYCECFVIKVDVLQICQCDEEYQGFQPYVNGYLNWTSSKWDYRKCQVEFDVVLTDGLSCLLDNAKDEIDLFECIEERCEINSLIGEVEKQNTSTDTPPAGPGWTMTLCSMSTIVYTDEPKPCPDEAFDSYRWCRQCLDVAPMDLTGWTEDNGKWYKAIPVTPPTTDTIIITGADPNCGNFTDTEVRTEWEIIDFSIDNGISFQDMFEAFAKDCDLKIISNFFGINPDGTNPNIYLYQCAEKELWRLKVLQASDVIYANAEDVEGGLNATKFIKTFEEFYTNLKKLFFGNLRLGYDPVNNCLRIEHVTYWEAIYSQNDRPNRYNLVDDYPECLPMVLEYDEYRYPQYERWSIDGLNENVDFDYITVFYPDECTTDNEDVNEECTIECIKTNITHLYNNEDLQNDEDTGGLVLISIDENGSITQGPGAISGNNLLNAPLALGNLFQKYGKYRRPLKSGLLNGKEIEFYSAAYNRKEPGITLKVCCCDWFKFNPNELVRGFFGVGKYDNSICFETTGGRNGKLTLNIVQSC